MYLSRIINKNRDDISLNNNKQKYEGLPLYSLRVKATTHSTVHVIKDVAGLEKVDDVITMLANNYIESLNEKDQILSLIKDENERKLRRKKKK